MKNKRIDTIDEALRIIYLENADTLEDQQIDQAMDKIDSTPVTHVMSASQESKLLARLTDLLTTQSLGQVILQRLDELKLTREQLSTNTLLPVEVINELIADTVYTNNIPIVLFRNLISHLTIKFENVEQSIRKTFELLEGRPQTQENLALQPAYRKGFYVSRDASITHKSDGKELYENAEALEKYLNRLKELMN